MSSQRSRKPQWNMLLVILVSLAALLMLEHRAALSPHEHKLALILLVLGAYGSLGLWVRSNSTALQQMDEDEAARQRSNPAIYGTAQAPTQIQTHYRESLSLFRYHSPEKRDRS